MPPAGVECILPLGMAWYLTRTHRRGEETRQVVVGNGQASSAASSAAGDSDVATRTATGTGSSGTSGELRADRERIAHMLVRLCMVQLSMRSGLWEKAFNLIFVDSLRGAHRISVRMLRGAVLPLRRRVRSRGSHGAAPGGAQALHAAFEDAEAEGDLQVPAGASGGDASSNSTDTELDGSQCPSHVVIISRPKLPKLLLPRTTGVAGTAEGAPGCSQWADTGTRADAAGPSHAPAVSEAASPGHSLFLPQRRVIGTARGASTPQAFQGGDVLQQQGLPAVSRAGHQMSAATGGCVAGLSHCQGTSAEEHTPQLLSLQRASQATPTRSDHGSGGSGCAVGDATPAHHGTHAADVDEPSENCLNRLHADVERLQAFSLPPDACVQSWSNAQSPVHAHSQTLAMTSEPAGTPQHTHRQQQPSPLRSTAAPACASGIGGGGSAGSGVALPGLAPLPSPPGTLGAAAMCAASRGSGKAVTAADSGETERDGLAGGTTYGVVMPSVAVTAADGDEAERDGLAGDAAHSVVRPSAALTAADGDEAERDGLAGDSAHSVVMPSVLGLPLCVSLSLLQRLDADGVRVLRGVCRGLYFEASRHIRSLSVTRANLETLVAMPMHDVLPAVSSLSFARGLNREHLLALFYNVLPRLGQLCRLDFSEGPVHGDTELWAALARGLPKSRRVHVVLREPTGWWARLAALSGLPGDSRDPFDHFPPLLEALKVLSRSAPLATADVQGVNLRKHTAARLPQLAHTPCVRALTLFGKSAIAVPHGHRLAAHLSSLQSLRHLTSLELLSYEDVSDSELEVLASCVSLRHLYVDSLFIKMATGPTFHHITSLAAARIKFILRPLTSMFPNLARLRLGVLYSELNKKINSASMSCLAGCSDVLTELVVCPVLWKGQWQVLPTLPGLRRLSLVHCKDLVHLREVLKVVGCCPQLEHLELHACSPTVAPWPGVVAAMAPLPPPPPPPPPPQQQQQQAQQGGGGPGAALAAALASAAAGGGGSGEGDGDGAPQPDGIGLYAGLARCVRLRTLVLNECAPVLVRHLSTAPLPCLRELRLQGSTARGTRAVDLQASLINLAGVQILQVDSGAEPSDARAHELPERVGRPGLHVDWRSGSGPPSLYVTRGFPPPWSNVDAGM